MLIFFLCKKKAIPIAMKDRRTLAVGGRFLTKPKNDAIISMTA
jgi:hypothetical protein